MIGAQPRPRDFACFLINGMRDDRKRMHVQPNARTLNNHWRPPDLQMWLYQRECSPTPATHESICSTRPSASASPHTVYTSQASLGVRLSSAPRTNASVST